MKKKLPCVLYIVRHGETDWNQKGLVQGHSDIPLSQAGEIQAHAKAEFFNTIPFKHIVSSDLTRAKQTAAILNKDRNLQMKTTPALREQSWGPWEGERFDVIRAKYGAAYSAYTGTEPHGVPGVESYHQVATRVEPFLCELAADNLGHTLLVVTHGGVLKGLTYRLGLSQFFGRHFQNLGFLKVQSDGSSLDFIDAEGLITH